jgi:hypothetical protein
MKRLFIGPWVGEFGVELLVWQAHARAVARREDWSEVIVATYPDRFFLYEDFATSFVPYRPQTIDALGRSCLGHRYNGVHREFIDEAAGDVHLTPMVDGEEWRAIKEESLARGIHIDLGKLGTAPPRHFDILVHARATTKMSPFEKNWSMAAWEEVVAALERKYSIASIGVREGASHVPGTTDLRGISLRHLAGYCHGARLVVGPSSGPIHFGMLCSVPVMTWADRNKSYRRQWNPLQVPLSLLLDWQPEPQVVLSKIENLLAYDHAAPARVIVIGNQRSGGEQIMRWIARSDGDHEVITMKDCIVDGIGSVPARNTAISNSFSFPKFMNEPALNQPIQSYGRRGEGVERIKILNFEGIALEEIPRIPEAAGVCRVLFVLKETADLVAELKLGMHYYRNKDFSGEEFRRIVDTGKSYLREALGITAVLRDFGVAPLFISYRRWLADEEYRREILDALGFRSRFPAVSPLKKVSTGDNSLVNQSGPSAGRNFEENLDYLALLDDPELEELERRFHGPSASSPRRARSLQHQDHQRQTRA